MVEVLDQLSNEQRAVVRAAHVREVLTGFRSSSLDLAQDGEPCESYGPGTTRNQRYAAKAAAAELDVAAVSVRRKWSLRSSGAVVIKLSDHDRCRASRLARMGG